jgi:hypothetical protein
VNLCPIDGNPIPERKTGRPATFCSTVCRKRADARRSKAARLLEFADHLEHGPEIVYAMPSTTRPDADEMQRRRDAAKKERVDKLRADAPGGPT